MSELLVVHALRCADFSSLGGVVAVTGTAEADVEETLLDLEADGCVLRLDGPFGVRTR